MGYIYSNGVFFLSVSVYSDNFIIKIVFKILNLQWDYTI